MSTLFFPDPEGALADLTDKQIEVLDLLSQHHTTKQIARTLAIAPNTVDQRIMAVREKWGTYDRNETARLYAMLTEACGKDTYGSLQVDSRPTLAQPLLQDLPRSSVFELADARTFGDWHQAGRAQWSPEALDARFGRWWRLAAILGVALAMAMLVLLSLSIMDTLVELL